MMDSPLLADVVCSFPFSWNRTITREEALWMINDMGWTPESIPNEGHTAMLRCAFRAAIAQFNLHEELAAAEALRLIADAFEGQQDEVVEAGADFRVNPAETILEQIVLPENSADAGVARQGNPAEAGFDVIDLGDLTPVPTVLASSESEASDADLVLPLYWLTQHL